jgi:ABC-type uncharacterized transport system ATPase subunit
MKSLLELKSLEFLDEYSVDLNLKDGDILWFEVEDEIFINHFIYLIFNITNPKKGSINFAGKNISKVDSKLITYLNTYSLYNYSLKIDDYIKTIACSKELDVAKIFNKFKNILFNLKASYALNLKTNEMTFPTASKVITSTSLAMPGLLTILKNPFDDLEKKELVYLNKEIKDLANLGVSFIIFSGSAPLDYTIHKSLDGELLK